MRSGGEAEEFGEFGFPVWPSGDFFSELMCVDGVSGSVAKEFGGGFYEVVGDEFSRVGHGHDPEGKGFVAFDVTFAVEDFSRGAGEGHKDAGSFAVKQHASVRVGVPVHVDDVPFGREDGFKVADVVGLPNVEV